MEQLLKEKAIQLRHDLHRYPELSGQEIRTKQRLMDFLRKNTTLEICDRGKWFYAYYRSEDKKGTIAFRADFDAIQVTEDGTLPYASVNPGVAHKCGHDGHSSALAAFAIEIDRHGAEKDIYFIFQHGEENGTGAKDACVLIEEKGIEQIYGVHNYPGAPSGTLCTRAGTICCASVGMELRFKGTPTHASTPELGSNPAKAVSQIILSLDDAVKKCGREGMVLATVIQVDIGERSFGVSASEGTLLLTVRGEQESEMNALVRCIENLARKLAEKENLSLAVQYHDQFPETKNDDVSFQKIKYIAENKGWKFLEMEKPLRTSEDFGYYQKKARGTLIWLGAGESAAPLHSKEFDYNDELIELTVELFRDIVEAE